METHGFAASSVESTRFARRSGVGDRCATDMMTAPSTAATAVVARSMAFDRSTPASRMSWVNKPSHSLKAAAAASAAAGSLRAA